MPAFQTLAPPPALYPGETVTLWSAESPVTGKASQEVALGLPYTNGQSGVSVEIAFSGDPGAFEIDVQDADTDTANAFLTVPAGGVLTTVSAAFYARTELVPVRAKFMRLKMVTQPANAVTVTAKISA